MLGFGVTFENDFYLLLHTPDESSSISFLLPEHASQQPLFRPAFNGKGVYLNGLWNQILIKKLYDKEIIKSDNWHQRGIIFVLCRVTKNFNHGKAKQGRSKTRNSGISHR